MQHLGTQHGGQGQRNQAGKQHGGGQRDSKFAEQPADVSLHERQRHEDRHQHQGGRHHGEADFVGTLQRGQQRFLSVLDAAVNIFQHHDGVIDHQANGEHQAEQGQDIDRVAHRGHHDKGGDHRHRHHQGGDQRDPERSEKQVDHDQHQRDRNEQRAVNFPHRRLDELGAVVVDGQHHTLGQLRGQSVHFLLDFARNLYAVGP